MLKIADIKKMEPDSATCETPTLKALVLDVSDIQKEANSGKERFYVVLADETDAITATVYNPDLHEKFKKEMGVIMIDILLKQSYIGVTRRTQVAVTQAIMIPAEVREAAPKIPGSSATISSILASPVKSLYTVKGKLAKVSPSTTKSVNGSPIAFQEVTVKDKSGKAVVAVWDNMVNCIEKGQSINISKCRVRLFEEDKRLSATKGSSLEVVASDEFMDVSDEDDDETDGWNTRDQLLEGTVIAVFEVDPYLACPIVACNNKKLITVLQSDTYVLKCGTCFGHFRGESASKYLRAVVLLNGEAGHRKVTIFLPMIKKMFESRGVAFEVNFDKTILMESLMKIIPFQMKYSLRGTTVVEIVAKRINE